MTEESCPLLLISVRSLTEVESAIIGGADILDIKEPHRGSLGAANQIVIAEIVAQVAGRLPVSAALGELREVSLSSVGEQLRQFAGMLRYVKIGLAGERNRDWQTELLAIRAMCRQGTELVPTAYADHETMSAPSIVEVATFAMKTEFSRVLIDTGKKDGRSLLHTDFRTELDFFHRHVVGKLPWVAAGSLQERDLPEIQRYSPWCIAIRGAACIGNVRESTIDAERVRQLATALQDLRTRGGTDHREKPPGGKAEDLKQQ